MIALITTAIYVPGTILKVLFSKISVVNFMYYIMDVMKSNNCNMLFYCNEIIRNFVHY